MKICICFIALQRTIGITYKNIEHNLINEDNEFTIIYVTWKNENIDTFLSIFPNTIVYRVDEITEEDEGYKKWQEGLKYHISLRYISLFIWYRQIYLWKKAADILKTKETEFDLMIRMRTDIIFENDYVFRYYKEIKENTLYFASEPRHSIYGDERGCPDQFFMGKPCDVIKALNIVDNIHNYKITYVERLRTWFPVDTLEENIVQPETCLYNYLKGEGRHIVHLPFKLELIR